MVALRIRLAVVLGAFTIRRSTACDAVSSTFWDHTKCPDPHDCCTTDWNAEGPDDCCQRCEGNSTCAAWEWFGSDPLAPACYLCSKAVLPFRTHTDSADSTHVTGCATTGACPIPHLTAVDGSSATPKQHALPGGVTCPPQSPPVTPMKGLNTTEFVRATWFVQQQQLTDYLPLDKNFCVVQTLEPNGGPVPFFKGPVRQPL
jgi:hypothetical protein